jgi:hypothetical protein
MIQELAKDIKPGDILYNCFMEPVKVRDKTVLFTEDGKRNFKFTVVDLNTHIYSYDAEDLYFLEPNLEDEDDIEKAWIDWAKNNKTLIQTFVHLSVLKQVFKTGFGCGFEYKRKISADEMLQK